MASKKNIPRNYGNIPPHDKDLEEGVLGAIISDKNAFMRISKDFYPEIFYLEPHKLIAESIKRLNSQTRQIDLMTIFSDLRTNGTDEIVGGLYFITGLTDRVVSTLHLEEHVQILLQHYYAREQITLYQEKIGELYAFQDPENIALEVSRRLIDIQKNSDSNLHTMKQLAVQAIHKREQYVNNPKSIAGYPSGVKELDKATNGFKEPELTVIAARPAMGKTVVALSIAKSTATEGSPVGIFSLEMAADQLYSRIQANETKINGMRIRNHKLSLTEREYLNQADQNLAELPIFIDDTASLNIDKLRMLIAIYIQLYGIKMVVVDYLQLLEAEVKGFGGSTSVVSQVSRKLKIYAKEFGIPIIALAQLSREVEKRTATGCKPILSDIRESGTIEQDADNVMFLWRPEYYEIFQEIPIRGYQDAFDYRNLLVFIIAKIREGETRSIPAYIDLSTMTIKDHPSVIQEDEQTEMPF